MCVADDGADVVIHGLDETSGEEAGLTRFGEHIDPQLFTIGDVEDQMAEHARLGDAEAGEAAVSTVLDRHGLDGWTIEHAITDDDDDDDPDACATYAFDEARSVGSIIMLKMPP